MRQFSSSLYSLTVDSIRNRQLIKALIQRDIVGRYRGSLLGLFWSFIHPVFMLGVYTFIFSVIFQARWEEDSNSKAEFAMMLFSGLIVFNFFAECFNRSPSIILQNPSYVKKIVFPLEVLPIVVVGSALFHTLVSFLVWLVFYLYLYGIPNPSILLLPIIAMPLLMLTIGISWLLAALGVYLRDISQLTSILTTILMFLSPIFYPASAIPEDFRVLLLLNPLTLALEHIRGAMMSGQLPLFREWSLYFILSLFVAWLGLAWFQKVRRGFADVL